MQSIRAGRAGSIVEGRGPGVRAAQPEGTPRTLRQRGQVLVLFVMSILVIVGLMGLVIDVSWYWSNSLRVQRAADAAALAGAVDLPAKPGTTGTHPLGTGIGDALAEAGKNGYAGLPLGCKPAPDNLTPTAVPGICAVQDASNGNQMDVTISAPVDTFFMRVFGIQKITATRTSKALFTLPVPMGSPENYYGVFGSVRGATMTTTTTSTSTNTVTGSSQNTGAHLATTAPAGTPWTTTSGTLVAAVATNDSTFALTTTNGATQQWGSFGLLTGATPIPAPITSGNPTTAINIIGLQVALADANVSAACANSTIGVAMSWDGGTNWSTQVNTGAAWGGPATLPTVLTTGDYTIGNNNDLAPWNTPLVHSWSRDDFSDATFRLRLTANKGCATVGTAVRADLIQVTVFYTISTTTTTTTTTTNTATASYPLTGPGAGCLNGAANCFAATPAGGGQALNTRGFWATMNTEGAANVNGDAYQPFYDTPTTTAAATCPAPGKACYDPTNYYNYAVYMPPGTTGGRVFIFDAPFCATALDHGTGDRWFGGNTQMSSWYELFDTQNTPYDLSDDTLVATSGGLFKDIAASDTSMSGSGGSECKQQDAKYNDGRDYHDSWYLLPGAPLSGGADGRTYRLHTTSSIPPGQSDAVNQKNANGEQSFAVFADDTQGLTLPSQLPQVYGLGAMQMFTPLSNGGSGSTNSEFYLAQVPAFYAGKTLEISLWDPGDTSPLSASLAIEIPTAAGWSPTNVTWTAVPGTTASPGCYAASGSGTSITTATPTSRFQGCWLTIDVLIPGSPTPYAAYQNGWWKIMYTMTGSGTSSDVTTWTAAIKGNPVHLVVP